MKVSELMAICINTHRNGNSKLRDAKVVKHWVEDGTLCMKWSTGDWWHYKYSGHVTWW